MSAATTSQAQPLRRTMRLVALPIEHGGWGFLFEPIVLGLLLAASPAGAALAVAAVAAFLVKHPAELVLADRRKGKRYLRTTWAERFVLFYAATGLIALAVAVLTADHPFWIPILAAAPLAILQIVLDMRKQGRSLAAELAGALALGASSTAIALAGGWSLAPALALWGILGARSVPSIIYVRARLRLERGGPADPALSWVSHLAGLVVVVALAAADIAPQLSTLAMLVLTWRAVWGLSPLRKPVRAPIVGTTEVFLGLLVVVLAAVGYRMGW